MSYARSADSGTSTEDTILNNIPGIDDNTGDDTGGGVGDTGTSGSDTGGARGTSAAPTETGAQPTDRVRHDGLLERPNPENNRARDLVDPRTGRIVARGGIERHVFEEGQRHARENATLKQELNTLRQHVGTVSEVSRVANELAVTPENQVIAIRVMADFVRDPVRTLQSLIEEVKAKGYPLPFLTEGVTPGMDLNAIGRMIDAKMLPLTQQQQAAQREAEQHAALTKQLDQFLVTNPEAQVNLGVIAKMMEAQPHLTLHDAYVKMMQWCYTNGLDYSQPIKPQIDAINEAAQQNTQQPTQQPVNGRRPLPNGRSSNAGTTPVGDARSFDENSAWGDIIRQSMQESGMSFR